VLYVQELRISRAELEARVRLELNDKLSSLNTFLQQHAEQCRQIDELRENNHQEIRQELRLAEQQLRVCFYPTCWFCTCNCRGLAATIIN